MRSLGTSDRLLSGYRVLIFIRKECSEFNVIDKSVYGDRDQPRGRRDEMRMGGGGIGNGVFTWNAP